MLFRLYPARIGGDSGLLIDRLQNRQHLRFEMLLLILVASEVNYEQQSYNSSKTLSLLWNSSQSLLLLATCYIFYDYISVSMKEVYCII